VTSAGTDYAAARGVEEVLAKFYLKHGTLAIVEPLRRFRSASRRFERVRPNAPLP
jgi:hypothetical protein